MKDNKRLAGCTVLVTGADGFIGSHLCKKLVKENAKVIALVLNKEKINPLLGSIKNKIDIIEGDITNKESLEKSFSKKIDFCIHLAAIAEINKDVGRTYKVNVLGTKNVLEKCVEQGIWNVIFSSTARVYGDAFVGEANENSKLNPASEYAKTKIEAEETVKEFHEKHGLNAIILRQANVFGPYDLNIGRLIPNTILLLKRGKEPELRAEPETERDFLHIEDLTELYIKTMEFMEKQKNLLEIFNATYGENFTVKEIIWKIEKEMGRGEEMQKDKGEEKQKGKDRETSEEKEGKLLHRQKYSSEKAAKILNWKPKCDFDKALRETVSYYKKMN